MCSSDLADELRELGIEVQHDLASVGGEILDHPESIIIWELKKPLGPQTVMGADCALFVNRLKEDDRPDLMYHTYQLPFTFNTNLPGSVAGAHAFATVTLYDFRVLVTVQLTLLAGIEKVNDVPVPAPAAPQLIADVYRLNSAPVSLTVTLAPTATYFEKLPPHATALGDRKSTRLNSSH